MKKSIITLVPSESWFNRVMDLGDPQTTVEGVRFVQDDNEQIIEIDMPGVNKKDITLDLDVSEDGVPYLRVSASRHITSKKKGHTYPENINKRFELSRRTLTDKIIPEYKDGVLRVTAPLKQHTKRLSLKLPVE